MKKLLAPIALILCFFSCNKEDVQEVIKVQPDFISTDAIIGIGDTVQFKNFTKNAFLNDTAAHYLWHFEGGVPEYSTAIEGGAVSYQKAGSYDVTLYIIKENKRDSINKKDYITVKEPTAEGLISYYPFNGNANNQVSQSNNGVLDYNTAFGSDRFGNSNSAYLSQHWNKISCGDNPISTDGSFTLSTMIYALTPIYNSSTYNPSTSQYIISAGAQSGSTGYYLLWNNGKLRFGRKTSNMSCDTIFGNFSSQKWYTIVSSYDSASHIVKIYVNNKKLIETSLVNKGETWVNNFKTLTIGAPNTPYDLYFNGVIDEIRLYNRVLSEEEIKYIR